MPEFHLDHGTPESAAGFAALDSFTQGYLEAAFFTETNELYSSEEWDSEEAQEDIREGRCSGGIPSDSSVADLAPEAIAAAISDCATFQQTAADLLELAYERDYDAEQAGRDFWFTRNGHGVGYWDRKALESDSEEWSALQRPLDTWTPEESRLHARLESESLGERLSAVARRAGNVDMYRGDDGRVYFA